MGTLRIFFNSIHARLERYFRVREVIRATTAAHERLLGTIPANEWPLANRRFATQIASIKAGNFKQVLDRRSWSYPYIPEALHRLNQPILKATPWNIRRFSETPIPRRAINLIKNTILSQPWRIEATEEAMREAGGEVSPQTQAHIDILTRVFNNPNNDDSFWTLAEAVLEDMCMMGGGAIEPRLTLDWQRPFKMWAVDGTTIRIFADWKESEPNKPRYAQMTGLRDARGIITFLDDELAYFRCNVRTSTPFGLGNMEVAFQTINSFLGVQDMSSRSAADQTHHTWMWWSNSLSAPHQDIIRRHLTNEGEGQGQISLVSNMPKPDVVDVKAVNEEDLLLNWQELLIRVIAVAFDLSPLALGIERDVNRSTSETMNEQDFKNAVVPKALVLAEGFNRKIIWKLLGWRDVRFTFIGLDDPDSETQTNIWKTMYAMDSILSDEIRAKQGLAPLPGKWGMLSYTQKQILIMAARGAAKKGGAPTPAAPTPTPTPAPASSEDSPFAEPAGGEPAGGEPEGSEPVGLLEDYATQIEQLFDITKTKELQEQKQEHGGQNKNFASKSKKLQQQRFRKHQHKTTDIERVSK